MAEVVETQQKCGISCAALAQEPLLRRSLSRHTQPSATTLSLSLIHKKEGSVVQCC